MLIKHSRKSGWSTAFADLEVSNALPHDIAIATPTLEVGIDMNNVTEVLTHKAIRNVSSYRQKVGRAGREPGTDAVAMTILSKNAADSSHLRSPSRLVIDPIADPVPVATENLDVVKNQAYEAVWDFLAITNRSVELIRKSEHWTQLEETTLSNVSKMLRLQLTTVLVGSTLPGLSDVMKPLQGSGSTQKDISNYS